MVHILTLTVTFLPSAFCAQLLYHPLVNPLFCRSSLKWLALCHYRRPGVKSSGIRIRSFALQCNLYMHWQRIPTVAK